MEAFSFHVLSHSPISSRSTFSSLNGLPLAQARHTHFRWFDSRVSSRLRPGVSLRNVEAPVPKMVVHPL